MTNACAPPHAWFPPPAKIYPGTFAAHRWTIRVNPWSNCIPSRCASWSPVWPAPTGDQEAHRLGMQFDHGFTRIVHLCAAKVPGYIFAGGGNQACGGAHAFVI